MAALLVCLYWCLDENRAKVVVSLSGSSVSLSYFRPPWAKRTKKSNTEIEDKREERRVWVREQRYLFLNDRNDILGVLMVFSIPTSYSIYSSTVFFSRFAQFFIIFFFCSILFNSCSRLSASRIPFPCITFMALFFICFCLCM